MTILEEEIKKNIDGLFGRRNNTNGKNMKLSVDTVCNRIVNDVLGLRVNEAGRVKAILVKKLLVELFNFLRKNGFSVNDTSYEKMELGILDALGVNEMLKTYEEVENYKNNFRYVIAETIKTLDIEVIYSNEVSKLYGIYNRIKINEARKKENDIYQSNKYTWRKSQMI